MGSERPKPSSLLPRAAAGAPLLGRDAELRQLLGALEMGARLISVTGPAGVGKTRLAHEVVGQAVTDAGITPIWPRLDAVTSSAGLVGAVEASLARAGARGDAVTEALGSLGPALLVIDPIDPLLEALGPVVEWLEVCPELGVLLIGRARSGLFGERIVELEPLAEGDAVRLFEAFAALHRPQFAFSGAEREAALAIVRALDRLPLALELAAPRLQVMTTPALLHRLKNRFDVLVKGSAPGRHGTLENAINWSLDLLEPGPRALLAETTVFRGGFTLEVAEAVLTPPANSTVEAALLHLRERSLLSVEVVGDGASSFRLGLLKSLRLLVERELASEAKEKLEEKHALAYVSAAEHWAREVELFGSSEARTQLALEHDNLAAVVERILERPNVSTRAADRALRVLVALGTVMSREGASALLRTHLETAIEVAQGSRADPRLLARALSLRGLFRAEIGRAAEAARDLAEALVLANHAGDAAIEARVLLDAARIASAHEAGPLLVRARQLADVSRDQTLLSKVALGEAKVALELGAFASARLGLEEALVDARRSGDLSQRAEAERRLLELGLFERVEPTALARHAEEALELAAVLADSRALAETELYACLAHRLRGDRDAAERASEASLEAARRSGSPEALSRSLVLAALGAHERSERGEVRALVREAVRGLDALGPDMVGALFVLTEALDERGESGAIDASPIKAATKKRPPTDPVIAKKLGLTPAKGPTLGLGALFGWQSPRSAPPPSRAPARRVLTLDREANTFAIDDGAAVDLSKRKPLRRLLAHVAAAAPSAVSWDALLGVGWPGEKMRADAGAHRVRVAISTLRKMGLSTVLETDEQGYRIKKDVEVRFVDG